MQELCDPTPECFSFITDDLVMVASLGAITYCSSLNIYDLSLPTSGKVCMLLLPQVHRQLSLLTTEINMSGDQSCQWAPHSTLKVPFYTSHKNKILGIMYMSNEGSHHTSFVLFVPISTILMHVHCSQARDGPFYHSMG